ncbi:dihydrofolate reductase-like domain-containing protein [Aspergillus venezuelensis]
MPPPHPPQPLTLIVATTPLPSGLGIGLGGTLPWPRIKSDMSFFARVTARLPLTNSSDPGQLSGVGIGMGVAVTSENGAGKKRTNALIMGRKTYDSVPPKLRPLGKRVSVVISRESGGSVAERVKEELEGKKEREREVAERKAAEQGTTATATPAAPASAPEGQTDAFVSSSLEDALQQLDRDAVEGSVGNVYVIGGAEIYGASLRLPSETESGEKRTIRIVMTDVEKLDGSGFECDTFFPVGAKELKSDKWRRVSSKEVSEWVGEEVSGEWITEGDIRVRMVGYERV